MFKLPFMIVLAATSSLAMGCSSAELGSAQSEQDITGSDTTTAELKVLQFGNTQTHAFSFAPTDTARLQRERNQINALAASLLIQTTSPS